MMAYMPSSHLQAQCMKARGVLETRVRQGLAKGGSVRHLVQDVLQFDLPIAARYKHLDVIRILQDNCDMETGAGLEPLIRALSILERYGKNLLRSDRPGLWRIVRLSNKIFQTEVDIIKGAREILKLLGYTKTVDDGLAYPEKCLVPDIPTVTSVTADILLLRQELMMLVKGEHIQENDFYHYIPYQDIKQAQTYYSQQSVKQVTSPEPSTVPMMTDITNHHSTYNQPMMQPPTYEAVLQGAGRKTAEYIKENTTDPLIYPHENDITVPSTVYTPNNVPAFEQSAAATSVKQIEEEELCDICGQNQIELECDKCEMSFCDGCDKIFHNNPKRRGHVRQPVRSGRMGREHSGQSLNGRDPQNAYGPGSFDSGHGGLPVSSPLMEQGAPGDHNIPPTISGARLPPTPTSRNASLTDNEWSRKVNRMAAELMDISNPETKTKRLMSFLNDLDIEAEKYRNGVRQLQTKGHEKPSLAAHFEEKIGMIDDLKEQLKGLVGYTDPPGSQETPVSRVANFQFPNHHDYNHNSVPPEEESWSFKSVKSQSGIHSQQNPTVAITHPSQPVNGEGDYPVDMTDPARSQFASGQRLEDPSTVPFKNTSVNIRERRVPLQRLEEKPPVPVANLIDFSAETLEPSKMSGSGSLYPHEGELPLDLRSSNLPLEGENKVVPASESIDDITLAKTAAGASGDPLHLMEVNNTYPATSHISRPSAEDPTLQSIFNVPASMAPPESPQNSLKRMLPEAENGAEQPPKLQRGTSDEKVAVAGKSTAATLPMEISTGFQNMNIEQTPLSAGDNKQTTASLPGTSGISYAFQEPSIRPEDLNHGPSTSDFKSAESFDYGFPQNRLEQNPMETGPTLFHSMSPEALQKGIRKEEDRFQTTQFLDWIRAGNVENFKPDHVQVAVSELEKEGNLVRITPNTWLERKWEPVVLSFVEYAKSKDLNMSPIEAEELLLSCDNSFDKAIESKLGEQNKMIIDLSTEYGEERAKHAMNLCDGDKYYAVCYLQQTEVKACYMEFKDREDNNVEDKDHMLRILEIPDDERKSHAHLATSDVPRKIYTDTLQAIFRILPNDSGNLTVPDIYEAASNFPGDCDGALRFLDNECMICTDKFPQSKITCLPTCGDNGCKYCLNCLQEHLAVCVRDKNIRDIVCPVCSRPEHDSADETKTDFINHIDVILRRMEDKRIHEIFQQKLRDFTLMRMPNFRWCSHCSGGFQWEIDREQNNKMVCPFCRKASCFKCKKQWESQHDGISCEQFQAWKESNDPEFQAAGLARHLKENGIDCPYCNFRYALAKGGCMHFKCTQCSHEFCSGCNRPFKHGKACTALTTCASKGLHAHHPRDCLFYLRDCDPDMLQKLLKSKNVPFDTTGPRHRVCQVMEQKETSTGMRDDICGRKVEPNNAGLCRLHYNEYLVNLVNANRIDPAEMFNIEQLKTILRREDIDMPKKNNENNNPYRQRLLDEVKKLPLVKLEPVRQNNAEM